MGNSKTLTAIGTLRHRILIEAVSRVDDGRGGFTETWAPLVSDGDHMLWARVKPSASRERFFSEQIQYQRTHVVTMRYRNDVTSEMRFTFEGRTFQIKGVRFPDEEKFTMILDCEENQGT